MTLLKFLAAFAALVVLLCAFIWRLDRENPNNREDSQ